METDPPDGIDHGPLSRSARDEREFAAAIRLRDWVKDFLAGPAPTEWSMTPGELNNIFIGTHAKGTKTFRAILLLADRGYGEQGEMLCRSLFEHAVVQWWLLLGEHDEEELMETLRRHRQHAAVLFERAMEQHPELNDDKRTGDSLDAETVAALDKQFGSFGRHWHGKRLDELVREVEDRVDQRYQTTFWKLFRFVNHHNNYTLHHSALGIAGAVEWDDPDDTPKVKVGPSPDWRMAALWAGCWMYGLLTLASLRRLSPQRADEFADFLDDVNRDFLILSPDVVAETGRNAECPCGSSRKFKNCHLCRDRES